MSARRGNPCHVARDWRAGNEALVLRGEFYLDLRPLRHGDQELSAMNRGKRGGSTNSPSPSSSGGSSGEPLVDYRGPEEIARRMVNRGINPHAPDYPTPGHRLLQLTPSVRLPEPRDLEVGSDGTARRPANAGEYRISRYGDPLRAWNEPYVMDVTSSEVRLVPATTPIFEAGERFPGKRRGRPRVRPRPLPEIAPSTSNPHSPPAPSALARGPCANPARGIGGASLSNRPE